jgi:hypothetical protein
MARVVAETENAREVSQRISRLASVDLPAPDGDDKIINRPRRIVSLHILHLLAHLIYQGLHFKPNGRQSR